MSKWPLRIRFWKYMNHITAKLAWRYADPGGEDWGKALRIDETKFLWKLNRWTGNRWIHWYMASRGYSTKDKK